MFCLTFVRDVDPVAVLRGLGADVPHVPVLSNAEAEAYREEVASDEWELDRVSAVRVAELGDWSVSIELLSLHGGDVATLEGLSRGTEAVSVSRDPNALSRFSYARDGELVTDFDPLFPTDRFGSDPDRFLDEMAEVGLRPDEESWGSEDEILALVHRVFGVGVDAHTVNDAKLPTGMLWRK
ncbi:hypothetical protein CEP50_16425 [Actinopolyspora mortivallis]|uniref:Uncharacterized protein n=2 Tax=Actinopolyspora mortivallis TaxID=33906 RepID=A0A2T0GT12_ACTMO|nr:hypothetical protein CEP50_16425 [Actinopolyspora mortivallis]